MKANRNKLEICMAKLLINQKDLAVLAGVSEKTLSHVVNERSCRAEILGKIAEALGEEVENIIA